jgi:hypothetical protein
MPGIVLVQAIFTQGTLVLERAPGYAVIVQDWCAYMARRWTPLLRARRF